MAEPKAFFDAYLPSDKCQLFSLGKRKKSQGDQSGKKGGLDKF